MRQIFLILFSLFILSNYINAQCIGFVKTVGFNELDTEKYVPEGRYDAITLSEGDYLKVYKSFFRGKTYKVVVVADKQIPLFHFKIKKMNGDLVYDSSENSDKSWEYISDRNQNLMIEVELSNSHSSTIGTGCVAIILGYKI